MIFFSWVFLLYIVSSEQFCIYILNQTLCRQTLLSCIRMLHNPTRSMRFSISVTMTTLSTSPVGSLDPSLALLAILILSITTNLSLSCYHGDSYCNKACQSFFLCCCRKRISKLLPVIAYIKALKLYQAPFSPCFHSN